MDDNILARLRALSEKEIPLIATTVRFSKPLDDEIRQFCAEHPSVNRSVILRECVERGWRSISGTDESST
jgi:hypothetical protein